jgi:hypothetical protein
MLSRLLPSQRAAESLYLDLSGGDSAVAKLLCRSTRMVLLRKVPVFARHTKDSYDGQCMRWHSCAEAQRLRSAEAQRLRSAEAQRLRSVADWESLE